MRFTYFADAQALNLAAIAGNFDMQERHINMTNYPVLKEQEKAGKYRVITWPTFGGADAVVAFNQTYTADPGDGQADGDEGFPHRPVAMRSTATQIKESVVPRAGRGAPGRAGAVASRTSRATNGRQKYTEFDRDQANKMLDGIGLDKKDGNGIRLLPNGKPATIEISVVPAFGAWPDVALLVVEGLGGGRHQDHRRRSASARCTSRCARPTS